MKKVKVLLMTIILIVSHSLIAQIAMNADGSSPDGSAMLDVKSNNKGLLLPRMNTYQMSLITNPATGLLVFNTDSSDFFGFDGNNWISFWNTGDTITIWACGDPITYGGQNYSTVQIGTQCWMAENLNIGTRIDGTANQTDNPTIEKYCYTNSNAYCDTYGGLYQWNEMMQYVTTEGTQGICPTAWHLPSDAEWKTMEMDLGMTQSQADATDWRGTDEGAKLKEPGTTHWSSPNTGASNSSGFTGLPGGYRIASNGLFDQLTNVAYFWSSSVNGSDAWYRHLYTSYTQVMRNADPKAYGYSVRCVQD
ncbi:MAG: hypothetical protein DRI89_01825 [Bacteroidetes bacterium]|nr:MAG: hypothetical protein DRI89_01825 [Bacteroidota bacterium]